MTNCAGAEPIRRRPGDAQGWLIVAVILLVLIAGFFVVNRLVPLFPAQQDQAIDLSAITKEIDIARKELAEVGRAKQAADAIYEKELHDIAADALPFGVLTPFAPAEAAAMIATTIEPRASGVRARRLQAMQEFDVQADQANAQFNELWKKRKELLAAESR
jgi:hypothetical protein